MLWVDGRLWAEDDKGAESSERDRGIEDAAARPRCTRIRVRPRRVPEHCVYSYFELLQHMYNKKRPPHTKCACVTRHGAFGRRRPTTNASLRRLTSDSC